jgi:hypothetical protein
VTLKFGAEGRLLYTVHERDKDQIMRLTHTVDEEFVVTSQPSHLGSKKLHTNLHPTESCCLPSAAKRRDMCAQGDATKTGWPVDTARSDQKRTLTNQAKPGVSNLFKNVPFLTSLEVSLFF